MYGNAQFPSKTIAALPIAMVVMFVVGYLLQRYLLNLIIRSSHLNTLLITFGLDVVLTYLAPPLIALFGTGWARILGLAAWLLMAIALQPTLRFYRVSPLWGIALPAIAFCYTLFTLDSALQFWRGKGGLWKGRIQAKAE